MDVNKNYYSILGVDKNSDESTIKKAFKRLAKEYHPDMNPGKGTDAKFKEINEAHQVLTGERDKYDQSSPHGKNYNPNPFGGGNPFGGSGSNPFNMGGFGIDDDIWNQILNNTYGARQAQQKIEALDINLMTTITLADVYNNKILDIKFSRKIKCPTCKGTGFDLKSTSSNCKSCNGSGVDRFRQPCIECAGTGKLYSKKCDCCKGERLIPKDENLKFETYRIKNDVNQVFQDMGNYSKYYNKVGNVSIIIRYQHDNKYEFSNLGLLHKIDIHYQDAIDGNPIEYDNLDGTKLKISLPKKSKDGDLIKLNEKGMLINKQQRGNLILRLNIIVDYDRLEKTTE